MSSTEPYNWRFMLVSYLLVYMKAIYINNVQRLDRQNCLLPVMLYTHLPGLP
jgi:hypothetical protein